MSVGGIAKWLIAWFGHGAILPESSSSFSCFDRR